MKKKIYDITLYYDQKDKEGNHIYHGKILIDDSFYFEGVISDKDYIKGIILSPQEYSLILVKNDNIVIDHYYCVREEIVNHYTVYKNEERKEEGNFSMGLYLTKQTEEEVSMFRKKLEEPKKLMTFEGKKIKEYKNSKILCLAKKNKVL